MTCPGSPQGQNWSLLVLEVTMKIGSTHPDSSLRQAAGDLEASSPGPCPQGASSVCGGGRWEADI